MSAGARLAPEILQDASVPGLNHAAKNVDQFDESDQLLRVPAHVPTVSPPAVASVMNVPSKSKDVWVGDDASSGVVQSPNKNVDAGGDVELSLTRTKSKDNSGGNAVDRPEVAVQSKPDGGAPGKDHFLAQLKALQAVKEQGGITEEQYIRQKQVLIDMITGTSLNTGARRGQGRPAAEKGNLKKFAADGKEAKARGKKSLKWEVHHGFYMGKAVVPKPPPDFSNRASERALQYVFNVDTGEWKTREVRVKIDQKPFARGSLRLAYHMSGIDPGEEAAGTTYVAKISIDPFEEREFYFKDVAMQMYTREYAEKYNTYLPPKRIYFVKAYLLELLDRPTRPLCAVERFIRGPYRKHNNNFGYVNDEERNTPQAFSHFTYEASQRRILICDIQGVGDMYTDPQIHSRDGRGFGKGNMGERGFKKFLNSHRCNAICRYLRLPQINATHEIDDRGTVPSERYMHHPSVAVITLELKDAHVNQVLGEIVKRHTQEQLSDQRSPLLGSEKNKKWCACTIL